MTHSGNWILRVDLEDFDGNRTYAEYWSFRIGDAESNYSLSLGNFYGTAGDAMGNTGLHTLNNMQFTTYDRDNDVLRFSNCAKMAQGAWWYRTCADSNLNGLYLYGPDTTFTGIFWYNWKNSYDSLKKSEMKIRRVQ